MPDRCALWTRGALALGLALIARASLGASLDFCHGPSEPGAAAQDRLIQVAALVKAELDQSGAQMALVSRSGLALQRLDQRYSHAGVSLKTSDNAPWSVRQLYYACEERRPRLFDQGMSGFVMGANDPDEGYLSIVLLPDAAAAPIERATRDDQQALKLLGDTYSANAFAFSTRYQNCNQWLAELMAGAWAPAADAGENRARAQQALMQAGYTPTVLDVGWQPLVWLAGQIRWLHTDDHPADDLAAARFRVSMPASIEGFVRQQVPEARRIEVCYTSTQVVIHRGWTPIATGCQPGPGDDVIALTGAGRTMAATTNGDLL
ncbi:MAG: DUF2145 domain-containing protein [Comamonadaceae bacterium]|nr:DUF2145 domain-containing protein [Comamonadaceae bacterium]